MKEKLLIGIAGGIGSGKSIVSRILRCNGYKVFDCDYEAKVLMEHDVRLRESLKNLFGDLAYDKDNKLNKPYISDKIFGSEILRQEMNALVHSRVKTRIMETIREDKKTSFVESAILFSSGIASMCDLSILVTAPEQLRIERVVARSNLSLKKINEIIKSQKEEDNLIKNNNCFIIDNDGISSLFIQLKEFLPALFSPENQIYKIC